MRGANPYESPAADSSSAKSKPKSSSGVGRATFYAIIFVFALVGGSFGAVIEFRRGGHVLFAPGPDSVVIVPIDGTAAGFGTGAIYGSIAGLAVASLLAFMKRR